MIAGPLVHIHVNFVSTQAIPLQLDFPGIPLTDCLCLQELTTTGSQSTAAALLQVLIDQSTNSSSLLAQGSVSSTVEHVGSVRGTISQCEAVYLGPDIGFVNIMEYVPNQSSRTTLLSRDISDRLLSVTGTTTTTAAARSACLSSPPSAAVSSRSASVRWHIAPDLPHRSFSWLHFWHMLRLSRVRCQTAFLSSAPPPPPPDPFVTPVVTASATSIDANWETYSLAVDLIGTATNVYTIYGTAASQLSIPAAYQCATPFGAHIGGTNAGAFSCVLYAFRMRLF